MKHQMYNEILDGNIDKFLEKSLTLVMLYY